MVNTGIYVACATSVNPQFLKNIRWNDLIFCTGALLSMPYGSTVGKIKIVSMTQCACIHYKLAMSCGVKIYNMYGGFRRIHICQPTVSEISHEMTSCFEQVLFSVFPMAPLLEKSRLCPGLNQLEAGHACHVVLKRYNKINNIQWIINNYAWK